MARPEKGFQFFHRRGIMGSSRKGTITSPAGCSLGRKRYCSLSPQGDDNTWSGGKSQWMEYCSLSPQGGDNLCDVPRMTVARIAAYPRKGAKTNSIVCCTPLRKYHPRKGAKNSASKKMRSFSFANLNSLFSVGCFSMNGTIAAAVIFSLLRLLHGDKMCYNKANSKHLLQN